MQPGDKIGWNIVIVTVNAVLFIAATLLMLVATGQQPGTEAILKGIALLFLMISSLVNIISEIIRIIRWKHKKNEKI